MKKILSIVVAIAMFMSWVNVTAFAVDNDELVISVNSAEVEPGGIATITLTVTANPGISYLLITPKVDKTVLSWKATNGDLALDLDKGINLSWSADEDCVETGVIATLDISVAADAAPGDYTISFIVQECYNENFDEVPASVATAKITVTCPHDNTELRNVQQTTCTEPGYTGDTYCKDCGEKIKTGKIIDELGHTEVTLTGKEATCTESGLSDGKKCYVCGEILVAQTTIPALGHEYKDGVCTRCGAKDPQYPVDQPQPGDGWGKWGDGIDPNSVVIYPVEGGNLYFGQYHSELTGNNPKYEKEIYLVSADSTIVNIVLPNVVNGLPVVGIDGVGSGESLVTLHISESVQWVSEFAFIGTVKLEQITVAENHPYLFSVDGVLYGVEAGAYWLVAYPAGKTDVSYTICDGTVGIDILAFFCAENLESIVIPTSMGYISSGAFDGCTNLKDIYFAGTEEQWDQIRIYCTDPAFVNATIHYNSTGADEAVGLLGDLNGDGKVNSADVSLLFRYVSRDATLQTLTAQQLLMADVNQDGKVNSADVSVLFRYVSRDETLDWIPGEIRI